MGTASIKILSMLWCLIFCGAAGVITTGALAVFQWLLFYFGLYVSESGQAFSSNFWSDFFKLSGGICLVLVCMLGREFWEEGITIDKK